MYDKIARKYIEEIINMKTNSNNDTRVFPFDDNLFMLWKVNYSGLMARVRKRNEKKKAQGYYDFKIGYLNDYGIFGTNKLTHINLFRVLKNNRISFTDCYEVWKGTDPKELTSDVHMLFLLRILFLFFLEQDINWGNFVWQRSSNFNSSKSIKTSPRTMLLGFLLQYYLADKETIKQLKEYEMDNTGSYSFGKGWSAYPYKRYFTLFSNCSNMTITFDDDLKNLYEKNIDSLNPYYRTILYKSKHYSNNQQENSKGVIHDDTNNQRF